jgi:GNAT superfamily N-acetyltransferase
MPGFRGQRSTYSPEWANAAELPESRTVYGEMYRRLAAEWVSEKYVAHYVSVLPNNREAISALHWLGFGLTGVDALRGLDPIPIGDGGYEIRRAEMGDLDQVMVLDEALWRHHRGPPIFLLAERKGRCHYEGWIRDPAKDLWLACSNDQPVAFMSLGPANEDVCAIIVDDRTTSIYGAFTREDARGKGLATALLNHALGLAREAGYVRCAVDFESANPEGARFWLRYFRPVCFSLFRNVDEGSLTA